MTAKTQPGAIPEDVKMRAKQIGWAWFGVGHHDAAALSEEIIELVGNALADRSDRFSRPDQPEAPGVEAEELRRYIDRCRELSSGGEYSWWSRLADILAALSTPSEERIRHEADEERIREDERRRLVARAEADMAQGEDGRRALLASDAFTWLIRLDRYEAADRAAKRTEGGR